LRRVERVENWEKAWSQLQRRENTKRKPLTRIPRIVTNSQRRFPFVPIREIRVKGPPAEDQSRTVKVPGKRTRQSPIIPIYFCHVMNTKESQPRDTNETNNPSP